MTQNLGEAKFLEGVRTAVALALHVTTRNKVTSAPVVPGIEGNAGSQTDRLYRGYRPQKEEEHPEYCPNGGLASLGPNISRYSL